MCVLGGAHCGLSVGCMTGVCPWWCTLWAVCGMYDRCVSLVVHIVYVEGITHVAVSTLLAVCWVYDV